MQQNAPFGCVEERDYGLLGGFRERREHVHATHDIVARAPGGILPGLRIMNGTRTPLSLV
jgi:hypothetical protein